MTFALLPMSVRCASHSVMGHAGLDVAVGALLLPCE